MTRDEYEQRVFELEETDCRRVQEYRLQDIDVKWNIFLALCAIAMAIMFVGVVSAHATEAPGCGNQHYRPRLAMCCPKYLAGETLPPKCTHALADGFLDQCCAIEPTPAPTVNCATCEGPSCFACPTPTATCPPEWDYCPHTSPTCAAPTPLPTPTDPEKGACCKEALRIYREVRRDIVARYRAELRAVTQRKHDQMAICREGYAR